MAMIEQAFHTYTQAVEAKFEASRRLPKTKGVWEVLPNKARHLCDLVEQLEEGQEFSALVEATRSSFRSDDWYSTGDEVSHFFRRTGYYTDTFFKGSDTPRDWFKKYEEAFQRRHVQATYLAPMEFVQFPKRELKFSGFEIRKFDWKELDAIVGNDVNRIFYPKAVVDTDVLKEYWFVVVTVEEKLRRCGLLTISKEDMGWVSPKYTDFPPAIERALERLVLFDWLEVRKWQYDDPNDVPRFGFKIPFVVRVDDDDLQRPQSAPDSSTLVTNPGGDEGEYEIPIVLFNLDESRDATFEECIQRADECLRHLRLETKDTHWPFLKVAIDNLIKAFFTDGLEQLLWHITALEALLGERGPGLTASLARRSAVILGKTEEEKEKIREQFKKLYDLRCALVHGRQFKKDVHREQLFEARMMVLQVMIWFVHYLSETAARIKEGSWKSKVPKREDFLSLLDLSNADCILLELSNAGRNRLSALLSNFPTGFPEDFLSLSDLSDADRDRLSALLSNLPAGFPSAPDWSP